MDLEQLALACLNEHDGNLLKACPHLQAQVIQSFGGDQAQFDKDFLPTLHKSGLAMVRALRKWCLNQAKGDADKGRELEDKKLDEYIALSDAIRRGGDNN